MKCSSSGALDRYVSNLSSDFAGHVSLHTCVDAKAASIAKGISMELGCCYRPAAYSIAGCTVYLAIVVLRLVSRCMACWHGLAGIQRGEDQRVLGSEARRVGGTLGQLHGGLRYTAGAAAIRRGSTGKRE